MTPFLLGSINIPGPYFHATGEGLTCCALDESTGTITRLAGGPAAENVIWMTRAGTHLWVATERYLEPGEISAFTWDTVAGPSRRGQSQSSHGGAICHISASPERNAIFVTSYLGGVSVHAVDAHGEVAPAHQIVTYQGSGPCPGRQQTSHPHQAVVSPDGSRLYVCDLGSDMIWIHPRAGTGLGPAVAIPTPPGSGPRHLAFHPRLPRLYLLGELDARLYVYGFHEDRLQLLKAHDTLPHGFPGTPAAAAIKFHPSGNSLTVSNRHSDTLTVFSVDPAGDLAAAACWPCGGVSPRDFAIAPSGRWLLAVNQDSHTVVPFELDPGSGLPTGRRGPDFACGSPCCALF